MRTTDKTNDAFKSLLVPNTVNGVVCLCVAVVVVRLAGMDTHACIGAYVKCYIESCVTQDKMLLLLFLFSLICVRGISIK